MRSCSFHAEVLAEELPHQLGNLIAVGLQREMPGVEKVVVQSLQVTLLGLRALGREDLVVLPPGDQLWRHGLGRGRGVSYNCPNLAVNNSFMRRHESSVAVSSYFSPAFPTLSASGDVKLWTASG